MNSDYLFVLTVTSAPLVLPLLILMLGLLMLRRTQSKRRRRMLDSENYATCSTTTSWELSNGPPTLSGLPEPHSFDNHFELDPSTQALHQASQQTTPAQPSSSMSKSGSLKSADRSDLHRPLEDAR